MRRISRVLVAGLAGLLALTGCSWSKASVGVQVDDTVISTASIDATVAAVKQVVVGQNQAVAAARVNELVVRDAVLGVIIDKARAAGMVIPQSAIDQMVASNPELANNPATAKLVETEAALTAIQQDQALQAQVIDVEEDAVVTVNPRYGVTWVTGQGAVADADGGSLSKSVLAG